MVSRNGIKLSKFTYNNKNRNIFIQNRIPDYGDGHSEGCIILGQVFLSLNSTVYKTKGFVKDVETLEPLIGSKISIWFQSNDDSVIIISDSIGEFEINSKLKISKIEVEHLGWRNLVVNMKN